MEILRRTIPSLNSLAVFEAAGRLESFSAAARELGISQAAVSYAVGRLEEQLATPLFHRQYRRVRLTEAGQKFHADVAIGLLHIQRSATELRAGSSGQQRAAAGSASAAARAQLGEGRTGAALVPPWLGALAGRGGVLTTGSRRRRTRARRRPWCSWRAGSRRGP